MLVKEGSKWVGQDRKIFYVNAVIELEGNVWIHYKEYGTDREYSCYQESYVSRFSPIVD